MSRKYSKVSVVVPDIKRAFPGYSQQSSINANIGLLKSIDQKYGSSLQYWGSIFEIPKGVLASFMATESGGTFTSVNSFQACGLMQVTPNALWETVRKWRAVVSTDMPAEAVNKLKAKVPFIYSAPSTQGQPTGSFSCRGLSNNACTRWREATTGQRKQIIEALTTDNDFNIMCGTLVLRWLLERFSSSVGGFNLGQLNKAIVGYNAGAYLRVLGGTSLASAKIPIDTTTLFGRVSSEPRNYLLKMLGQKGFLELVYVNGAIK
jgi:soluble lytic murein transglycosylase-like protein